MRYAGLLERRRLDGEAGVLIQALRVDLRGQAHAPAPLLARAVERSREQLRGDTAPPPVAFDGGRPMRAIAPAV
jgi:hypothetical protein